MAVLVRVGDLLREPGSSRPFDLDVDLGVVETSAAATVAGEPVHVDGVGEGMTHGVVVRGTVEFAWEAACRRCLEPVHGQAVVDFREVAQHAPIDEEVLPIVDDAVDVQELARELVLAGLPLAPLCRPDCPGPAPERFPTGPVDEGEDAPAEPAADPRWSALSELKFD